MTITFEDKERAAYMAGDEEIARLMGRIVQLEEELEVAEGQLESLPTEDEYAGLQQDLDAYEQFLWSCVTHTGMPLVPAPSIYDEKTCDVILGLVKRGEDALRNLPARVYLVWQPGPGGVCELIAICKDHDSAMQVKEELDPEDGAYIVTEEVE